VMKSPLRVANRTGRHLTSRDQSRHRDGHLIIEVTFFLSGL
jgi:hypothetical protein